MAGVLSVEGCCDRRRVGLSYPRLSPEVSYSWDDKILHSSEQSFSQNQAVALPANQQGLKGWVLFSGTSLCLPWDNEQDSLTYLGSVIKRAI